MAVRDETGVIAERFKHLNRSHKLDSVDSADSYPGTRAREMQILKDV